MAEPVERYLVELVMASRSPQGELANWLDYGSSPRGTIGLDTCARALAWLDGRDFVTPQDIQQVAHDVLRHRLILSFEADAQGITTDQVIDLLLQKRTLYLSTPLRKPVPGISSTSQTTSALTGAYVDLQQLLSLRHSAHKDLTSNSNAVGHQSGLKISKTRGRGVDFSEVRQYQPGDDARMIDWRVTARKNKPHTKIFREERERPVLIFVDQSQQMFLGRNCA